MAFDVHTNKQQHIQPYTPAADMEWTFSRKIEFLFIISLCNLKGWKQGRKSFFHRQPRAEFTSLFVVREPRGWKRKKSETQLNVKFFVPSSQTNTLKPRGAHTRERERGVRHQHNETHRKRMKSEPRKKKNSNVNETKNLSQTSLSRSTDKVLQPRKKFRFLSRS